MDAASANRRNDVFVHSLVKLSSEHHREEVERIQKSGIERRILQSDLIKLR